MKRAGIPFPDESAVVGVDNEVLRCEFARVTLSSVDLNLRRLGFRAAGVLDDLLNGRAVPEGPLRVPPAGVVARRSTDALVVDDAAVRDALRYIHEHDDEPLSIEEILSAVTISRRRLEIRFRKAMGRTLLSYIRQRQIRRVCHLLTHSDLAIRQIAERCGFATPQYLTTVFRKEMGTTPGRYAADAGRRAK